MRLLCTFPTAADFSPEIRVDVSFASILRECSILTFGGQVAGPTAVGTVQNVEGNTKIGCKWFNPLSHDSGKMSHPFAATMSSLKLMPLTKAAATAVEWQSTKPAFGAEAMPLYELPMGVPFVLPFICRETKRHKMNSFAGFNLNVIRSSANLSCGGSRVDQLHSRRNLGPQMNE